jgi:pimeloyl-ACP methyl ester carboxylesterase
MDSGPWGPKINYLAGIARKHGSEVESLDYSGMDAPQRAEKLALACRDASRPLVFVGSSMGGWVATAASREVPVCGLFLLAPAFYFPGYPDIDPGCSGAQIEVVHGWGDDVILYEHSLRFAKKYGATLHLLEDDHRLFRSLERIGEYFSDFLSRLSRSNG